MRADTPSGFTLDQQLCFALHSASRAVTGAYRGGLAELGLTYTQYLTLLLLWEEQQLSLGELGRRLDLDSATLSPVVKRLEAHGLVSRQRSTEDERRVTVACTPAGHELKAAAYEVQQQVERATGLSAVEIAALRSDLHRLADRLRAPDQPALT